MTDWGKAFGLTVLGLSVLGLAALAMSGGEESDGIPVTESPPEEVTDTDEDDGD